MKHIAQGCVAQGFAALAFIGCGGDGPALPPAAQVVDSAGVTVVTSLASDAVYAELAAEPSLSIGALEGPEEVLFDGIATVVRDGDGNFILADVGTGEVRVFDAGGNHLHSFGGRGEGPGEFQSLVGAWPLVDGGILAADRRLQRILRFDSQGTLLATGSLAGVDAMAMLTPVGLAGPETFLSRVRPFSIPSAGESPTGPEVEEAFEGDGPMEHFQRYGFDGALVDTLTTHPGQRMSASASGGGQNMRLELLRVPFSAQPSANGSVRGVAITAGTAYEVEVFDPAGSLSRIVRLDEAPPARTDEHLEAHVRGSGNPTLQDEASVRQMVARYEEMPLPETLPAYVDLRMADTGDIWARRYSERGAATFRWDVFGADGHYRGRVEVPASFSIEEVGAGQVVGVSADEFGVERVEVRELTLSGR